MKKLFTILSVLLALTGAAQVAPPGFVPNYTATAYRNLSGYGMFGMPQDTFAIPTADKMFNWAATKNDIIYIWSITQQKWIVASGSSPQTLTISSPLTGISYNGSSPITIGIDTTIVATRAYVGNNIPLTIYTGDGSIDSNTLRTVGIGNNSALIFDMGGGNGGFGVGGSGDAIAMVFGNGLFEAGDYYNNNTGTNISIDAPNQVITMGTTTESWVGLDGVARTFRFGLSGGNSTHILINDASQDIAFSSLTNTFAGKIIGSNLATGGSAPVTTGTTKQVITDQNGLLSFTNKTFDSIPYSATPNWDYVTGYDKTILLTGDADLTFANVQDGDQGTLIVIQDITGGHALTVPDQIVTLNTNAGDTTVLGWINQNGVYYFASSVVAPSGVTSVTGTSNRITSTGGTTPVIDISASYVGQSSITTHGTITSGGLGTGAVIGGVTMTLGSDATGDIYYRNSSGILTRLGVGTSKQTLHGGTNPQWLDTAATASGIVVGTTTVTSGTNTRILFDNSGTLGEYAISGSVNVAMTTSPVFTTPSLGAATATSINGNTFTTGTYTLTGQAGKTLTFNGSITLTGTDAQTYTFPTTTATIARTDAAQTFTGVQTFSSAPVISSITNTGTLTLPTVTGTVGAYSTASISSSATPAPTGDSKRNELYITALATAITSMTAPSGTPANGNNLLIRIKDNNTVRAITWDGIYVGSTDMPLPTVTTQNKTMYCYFTYNSTSTKWEMTGFINNFGLAQIFLLSIVFGGLLTYTEKKIKRRIAA